MLINDIRISFVRFILSIMITTTMTIKETAIRIITTTTTTKTTTTTTTI